MSQRDAIFAGHKSRYPKVPRHTMGGLLRYWYDRCPVDGFLYAVLSNDLMEACGCADEQNQAAIFDICTFVYNELPSMSYGSPEKVKAWLEDL